MDWTEVKINIDSKDVETAGNIAQMVVPYGIYIEDYSDLEQAAWEIAHIDLIDEDLLKKDRNKATIHIYISPEESPAEAVAFLDMLAQSLEYLGGLVGVLRHLVSGAVAVFAERVGNRPYVAHLPILKLHALLLEGHAREQVLDARVDRRLGVLIQRTRGTAYCGAEHSGDYDWFQFHYIML